MSLPRITKYCLIILLSVLACSQKETVEQLADAPLRIGITANYPPFESRDTVTGELVGFDVDLIRLVCEYNGWTYQLIDTGFEELIPAMTVGELDMAISAITITPQRAAQVLFSDPYYLSGQTIAIHPDDSVTKGLDDLLGKRVGVQRGSIGDRMARSVDGAHVFPYTDATAALDDLAIGKLDAVINDYPMTRAYIENYGGLKTTGGTLNAEYYGIAVRTGREDLLSLVDSALSVFAGDNTHENLHQKWFGYPLLEVPGVDTLENEGR